MDDQKIGRGSCWTHKRDGYYVRVLEAAGSTKGADDARWHDAVRYSRRDDDDVNTGHFTRTRADFLAKFERGRVS